MKSTLVPRIQLPSRPVLPAMIVFVFAVAWMASALSKPVHGHFYFRQGHIMANIEKFVANGQFLHPSTYNRDIPYSLFDFPAYEIIVALLCRLFGEDPLLIARLLSLTCFAMTLVLIDELLVETGEAPSMRWIALLLFAFAPLSLFYFVTPLVDVLALSLSLLSLYVFLRCSNGSSSRRWFWVVGAAGTLATLIKNPVYLPFFVAILAYGLSREGTRFVLRRETIAFIAAVGGAVILFKLYSNHVNGISGFLSASENADYFGPLADRLDPQSWRRILRVEQEEILGPVTSVAAVVGLVIYVLRSPSPYKMLYLGLAAGGALSLLIFFQRYTWHDYYQLPLVLPVAYFAAYGLTSLLGASRWLRERVPALGILLFVLVPTILAWSIHDGVRGFGNVSSTPTDWIERNGEWIREMTNPTDFVVYVMDTEDRRDWNPVFLYFAKRDGYNLSRKRVSGATLTKIHDRFSGEYSRVFVFCPTELLSALETRILESGATLDEAGPPGYLYALER